MNQTRRSFFKIVAAAAATTFVRTSVAPVKLDAKETISNLAAFISRSISIQSQTLGTKSTSLYHRTTVEGVQRIFRPLRQITYPWTDPHLGPGTATFIPCGFDK